MTGGLWYVQTWTNSYYAPYSTNYYYNDWIGLAPGAVGYYQKYRSVNGLSLPCTITVPQQMVIGVAPTEATPYGSQNTGNTNTLEIKVNSTSVTSSRAGVSVSNTFSFPL